MTQKHPDNAVILLAEDREDDVILIKEGFSRADVKNPLYVERDGDEAVAYLQGEGEFANRDRFPFPDLVLLDLQMPKRDGFEVLEWIRSHPNLKPLRAVVLTSSCDVRDINRAYSEQIRSWQNLPISRTTPPSVTPSLSSGSNAAKPQPFLQKIAGKQASDERPCFFD